jgi:hypothetical protein
VVRRISEAEDCYEGKLKQPSSLHFTNSTNLKKVSGAKASVFSSAVEKSINRTCATVILPVVLYGCETWNLILREEYRLRAFENRVLRRIFGPKRDRVTGGCRKMHNDEPHDLYSSLSIIRIIKLRRMR